MKNKFMPNCGCLIMTRRYTEKRLKPLKRRRRFTRQSIFSLGRTKIELESLRLLERRK